MLNSYVVFDAVNARPITGAQVAILKAPAVVGVKSVEEFHDRFPADLFEHMVADERHSTGADGAVVIDYEFRTGASHKRPKARAHLSGAWVMVAAKGYGGVVIPVRHDSQSIEVLREKKEVLVMVGLMRAQ